MQVHEKLVEKGAAAIYRLALADAKSQIDRTGFDSSDLPKLSARLRDETETAQVLIVSSYIEDRVEMLIREQLVGVNSTATRDRLFAGTGPLSSIGNRLTLAYHLGWLSKARLDRLNNFRKIRNRFAHNAFRVSLTDTENSQLFESLIEALKAFAERCSVCSEDGYFSFKEMPVKHRNIAAMLLLSGETFIDLLVLPASKTYRVNPLDLVTEQPNRPTVMSQLLLHMANAIFAENPENPA